MTQMTQRRRRENVERPKSFLRWKEWPISNRVPAAPNDMRRPANEMKVGDLMGLVAFGLTKIQAALARAVNPAEIAALQNAYQ